MGYTTEFDGQFNFDRVLDPETLVFLRKLNRTRRMARKVPRKFGVEGEFYVDGPGARGDEDDPSVIDYNRPPKTQPGLWCKWTPNEDGTALLWDQGEKFYDYVEWLHYLVEKILAPRGYTLTGTVGWQGEDRRDFGQITVKANVIKVQDGVRIRAGH